MTAQAHRVEFPGGVRAVHPMTTLSVVCLLRGTVLGQDGQHLGHVQDVVVDPDHGRDRRYPSVIGLVALLGTCEVFVPASAVAVWGGDRVQLVGTAQLSSATRSGGDLLLGADVLGRRLVASPHGRSVRAHDLLLTASSGEWCLSGVGTRSRVQRWLRPGRRDGNLDWRDVRTDRLPPPKRGQR